jgi:hypothetical protein
MFEDFRKQTENAAFPEEMPEDELKVDIQEDQERQFLGMTAPQRFVVAVLLLFMVILLGALFLLVTSKVTPPFFS